MGICFDPLGSYENALLQHAVDRSRDGYRSVELHFAGMPSPVRARGRAKQQWAADLRRAADHRAWRGAVVSPGRRRPAVQRPCVGGVTARGRGRAQDRRRRRGSRRRRRALSPARALRLPAHDRSRAAARGGAGERGEGPRTGRPFCTHPVVRDAHHGVDARGDFRRADRLERGERSRVEGGLALRPVGRARPRRKHPARARGNSFAGSDLAAGRAHSERGAGAAGTAAAFPGERAGSQHRFKRCGGVSTYASRVTRRACCCRSTARSNRCTPGFGPRRRHLPLICQTAAQSWPKVSIPYARAAQRTSAFSDSRTARSSSGSGSSRRSRVMR